MTVTIENTTLSAYGFNVSLAELPSQVIVALAEHGFKQKLGDAAAMTKEEKDGKTKEELESKIKARRESILKALLAGEFTIRTTGPRKGTLESVMADIAIERLRAAYSAKGYKWPTGKGSAATINELVEKVLAKHGEAIEAEAKKRLATQTKAVDDILDLV